MKENSPDHGRFNGVLSKDELDLLMGCIGGSPIPSFVIDRNHRIIYWNRALEELSKIKAEEVIGTNQQWRAFYNRQRPCLADLLVDEAVADIPQWYGRKYLESPLIENAYEATDFFPELGDSGRWLRLTAALLRYGQGPILGAVETLEDITGNKAAEAALLKAREELEIRVRERTAELAITNEILQRTTDQLSLLLESLPIVSYTRSTAGKYEITFVSNSVEEITGYSPADLTGRPAFWQNRLHPDDRHRVIKVLKEARGDRMHHCEYRFRAADHTYRWFSDFWRLVRMPDVPVTYFVGIWQDVTEDKRIRQESELRLQQIIQTHKLTALGEVVAGVAHEINNPVSFLSYNIPLLEEIWDTLEPVFLAHDAFAEKCEQRGVTRTEVVQNMREIIHAFKMATSRINRVITGLKEFSRSDELAEKKSIRLADVIQGVLVIVGAQVRKTVSIIELKIDPVLPAVQGHFQKLEQVLTNLLINAHQAISPGRKGKIFITAKHIPRLHAVVVTIEDNGKGMSRETMDHIFYPFFTTRRDSGGTGLGLSISYGLIKEHGGTISVLSQPRLGSRFSLYLPAEGQKMAVLNPLLLCIDSDAAFLKDMEMHFPGAITWLFKSPDDEEQLLLYLDDYPDVDWVICAQELKGINGRQLLTSIKQCYPLLHTALYGPGGEDGQADGGANFVPSFTIQKPFDMDKLHKMIQETGRQRL
jgi:two-component system, NtrC family, sensor kinase